MSNNLSIAKVTLPLPIDKIFDYYIPRSLSDRIQNGTRVNVMFNNKSATGYVVSRSFKSRIKTLNPILEVIDKYPLLSTNNMQLAKNIKNYYVCSLGEAIESMLPNVLRKSRNITADISLVKRSKEKKKRNKITYIQNLSNEKTYSYFMNEIINRIKEKKRVIFLVPEINMINTVKEYFIDIPDIKIAIWHGKLSRKKMLNLWSDLANDMIDLIIGTRSCIYAPVKNLDLIIIECEGDYAYKDDQVPYYHAVKVAQMRSEIEGCDVILSSLVPSAQTYQSISCKKILSKITYKPKRLAKIQLTRINYRDKMDFIVEKEIELALERKEKILIFLNRRGFATFIYCRNCKDTLKCSRCSRNLRFNYFEKKLNCPYCGFKTEMVEICPKCNSAYVKYGGLGVEKLESNLKRNFPTAKIISLDTLLKTNHKIITYDILIATKKIIKSEDIRPDITIIWNLDSILNIGDFHSGEETYRLLSKLLYITAKKIIISTSLNDEFYLIRALESLDIKRFYKAELRTRKNLKLPPYYHLGLVSIRSFNKRNAEIISSKFYSFINGLNKKGIEITNFDSASRSRLREKHYKYLLIKSNNIKLLNNVLKKGIRKFRSKNVIATVNIDPI